MNTSTTIWVLVFLATAAWAAPEDARFSGGSYDGWDRDVMAEAASLGGALVSFSSGTAQTFDFTTASGALATLTIHAEEPQGTIANGGTIRVTVPAAWACRFDTGAVVTLGGNAAGKVGAASYEDGGRTLGIEVSANFANGDTLTIAGLRLVDLRLVSPGAASLELDFTGDGARDVYDEYALTLRALWPGGSYDGWDTYLMAEAASLESVRGTLIMMR